ncbi:MAG: hypothetical protein LQ349_006825 [Xanthoria aureola]|nr:MAG: hypothetical protein LQ349_006825 [Xanthoria aureola]
MDYACTKIDGKYYYSIPSATGVAASGLSASERLEVYDLPGTRGMEPGGRGIECLSRDLKHPNNPAYRELEQNVTPWRPLIAVEGMKQILEWVERDFFRYDNTKAGVPFQDDMSFAAFGGCESYIRRRLSPRISDEQLEALLESVVFGMDHCLYTYVQHTGFPISWLNIVDILLQLGELSRVKTNVSKNDKHSRSSLWGALFGRICQAYKMARLLHRPASFGESESALFGERCHKLIEKFLSLGADSNTRICHSISVCPRNRVSSHFFADRTPLAIIQSSDLQKMKSLPEIETILKSKRAVNQTRYRSLLANGTYYRIDTSQAKGLDDLLFSKPRIYSFYPATELGSYRSEIDIEADEDEVFDVLEGIISTNERLDSPMMVNRWAPDGSEWLEDDHEPEI